MKQMHPRKASGSDGLNPSLFFFFFFRNFRIKLAMMCKCYPCVLNCHAIPTKLNHILVALIAKKPKLDAITEYHPISLCNVINKFVTKSQF